MNIVRFPEQHRGSVIYLVYVSSAVKLFSSAELQQLLRGARENNSSRDITGMLLYKDGNFMQVLEGLRDPVLALHDRISRDPRHKDLVTMLQGSLETRQFADWSMGFGDLTDADVRATPGYSDFLQTPLTAGAFAADAPRAMRLLGLFKKNMQ